MKLKNEVVLLITASINPVNTPKNVIADPKVRENQYVEAFKFYSLLGYPIVFIDSSNTISENILAIGETLENFEYHTFLSLYSYLGKGCGEKEIFDYGFENSNLIKNTSRIIKITGRYKIKNLRDIIESIKFSNADVCVNFSYNTYWCDSRIIIFKPIFYSSYFKPNLEKYLEEKYLNMPFTSFFENVLSRSVHLLIADGGKYEPWPVYPFYSGVNGENGREIEFDFLKRIKYRVYYRLKLWFMKQLV